MSATTTLLTANHCPPGGVLVYDSHGGANSDVAWLGPATFLRVSAINTGASALYLQIFDAATVGGITTPIVAPIVLPVGVAVPIDFSIEVGAGVLIGRRCVNGIVWVASTTALTTTPDTHGTTWVTVQIATGAA